MKVPKQTFLTFFIEIKILVYRKTFSFESLLSLEGESCLVEVYTVDSCNSSGIIRYLLLCLSDHLQDLASFVFWSCVTENTTPKYKGCIHRLFRQSFYTNSCYQMLETNEDLDIGFYIASSLKVLFVHGQCLNIVYRTHPACVEDFLEQQFVPRSVFRLLLLRNSTIYSSDHRHTSVVYW